MSVSSQPKSPRERFLEFDPNDQGVPFASYVYHRNPEFKTHSTRRTALGSLANHSDQCALYVFKDGKWELIARKDREGSGCVCGMCGGTTIKAWKQGHDAHGYITYKPHAARWVHADGSPAEPRDGTGFIDVGVYSWRRASRKIADPLELLYLCEVCAQVNG